MAERVKSTDSDGRRKPRESLDQRIRKKADEIQKTGREAKPEWLRKADEKLEGLFKKGKK